MASDLSVPHQEYAPATLGHWSESGQSGPELYTVERPKVEDVLGTPPCVFEVSGVSLAGR